MSAIFQLFFGSILPFPSLQRMEKHSGLPLGFSGGSVVKDLPASAEDTGDVGFCLSQEDPLEEGMATHPFHCLENPMDRRTSWFTVHRVAKTQTRWKWLKRSMRAFLWTRLWLKGMLWLTWCFIQTSQTFLIRIRLSHLFFFLTIHVVNGVAVLISIKTFFFAFTTWQTGWNKRLTFGLSLLSTCLPH